MDTITVYSRHEIKSQWHNVSLDVEPDYVVLRGEIPSTPKVVLLLSRLPLRVLAEDEWLKAVRSAVQWAGSNGCAVISSVGLLGWDYVTWYAADRAVPLIIVLPPMEFKRLSETVDYWTLQFQLPANTAFLMPMVMRRKLSKSETLHLRDQLAFDLADRWLPIVIRRGGFWDRVINRNASIDHRFQVSYPANAPAKWRKLLHRIFPQGWWNDHLFHWTRGAYAPWAGETKADYFRALTDSPRGNPRDAFSTLRRIVLEGVLRGQETTVRFKQPVVSFTALAPDRIGERIKYRAVLKHWTYEPYGLALPKRLLEDLGARPVIYGDDELFSSLPSQDKPFFQFGGRGKMDWRDEQEWRMIGDIDLYSMQEAVVLLVPTAEERERLTRESPYQVRSLISSS